MLSKAWSAALSGIDAFTVIIEINATEQGQDNFVTIVGLPDAAIKESRSRIRSAMESSGYLFPEGATIINLAPADVKKEGAAFDLPIALGVIAAMGELKGAILTRAVVVGELALDGTVRPIRGALSIALHAAEKGASALLLPVENADEAAVVENLKVFPISHLRQAVDFLNGKSKIAEHKMQIDLSGPFKNGYDCDFLDVKGQTFAKRALEVAAAGGHNVIMIGPPGTGKSMLAKRIPSILPPLTFNEALEITRIHSVGKLNGSGIVSERPFTNPHHSISDVGLIGGGTNPHPGEISYSHNGVLFLDELPEFKRHVLENMRQPLENGYVTVSRSSGTVTFPADFMLVAAMNPCPCGYYGGGNHSCRCTSFKIDNYRSRISGPLLDRIDIHIELCSLSEKELLGKRKGEPSETIRERVINARDIQNRRFVDKPIHCNAQMGSSDMEKYCSLNEKEKELLKIAIFELKLSARAFDRILRVARTIADLDASENISAIHLSEAIQLRSLDRKLI